jgi:hypothetical protein
LPQLVQEMKQKVYGAGPEAADGLWFFAEKFYTNFNIQ